MRSTWKLNLSTEIADTEFEWVFKESEYNNKLTKTDRG